jgi:hypothetical protein
MRNNRKVCFAPHCGIGVKDAITYAVAGGDLSEIEAVKDASGPSCLLRTPEDGEEDDWADASTQTF